MIENNRRSHCNGRAPQGHRKAHDEDNLRRTIVVKDTSIAGKNGEESELA